MVTQTLTYRTLEAGQLRLDLHHPGSDRTAPVVLWLHGGGLIGGTRGDIPPSHVARYLDGGVAVAAIDYRLAPEAKLALIESDVIAAHRWLMANGDRHGLDPARLGLVGHSAGGYLSLLCGPRLSPLPRAIVTFYGYGDAFADWYATPSTTYREGITRSDALAAIGDDPSGRARDVTDRMRFYRWCRQEGRWPQEVIGLDLVTDRDELARLRPITTIGSGHPPTMLLHGVADTDVPAEESIGFAAGLAAARVEHELLLLPGLGHGFEAAEEDPLVVDAMDRVLDFLARHLA